VNTAAEIMSALAACHAQVVIEGDCVRVRFPVGHPPPATLVEAARAHRATLREMLERRLAVKHYDGPMAVLKSECPPGIESGAGDRRSATLTLSSLLGVNRLRRLVGLPKTSLA
jgi:hypothetical protein